MKLGKMMMALLLALCLPVTALAGAQVVGAQDLERSIDLGTKTNTYLGRVDGMYALYAMDGTKLSGDYASTSLRENGSYIEVTNEEGINKSGVLNAAGQLIIPMEYSDFQYAGGDWVIAIALEPTDDVNGDYKSFWGEGQYNVTRGDVYLGDKLLATLTREEVKGMSANVYGSYLYVRLSRSSGFYLKEDGTRTEFAGESFTSGEYEEQYKKGVYHHPTAQYAFTPTCTLTAEDVDCTVWYDENGNFIDLQGNVISQGPSAYAEYESVRYYGGDYLVLRANRKYGLADLQGNEVIPAVYTALAGYSEGLCYVGDYQAVLEDGKLRYLDRAGQVTASADYALEENDYKGFYNNAPMVYVENMGKCLVITAMRGELPEQYEEAQRCKAKQQIMAVKKDGLWGCIDMTGAVVIPFEMKYEPTITDDGQYVLGRTEETYRLYTVAFTADEAVTATVKCASCGYEPAGETPKFCPECGTKFGE